jgi:hypothetical protein
MPRPRTPTATLNAKGSFLHDPKRKRARLHEPRPTSSLGGPPERFCARDQAIWFEVAAMLPAGVAANCDRWAVELLVCLMSKFRAGRAKSSEAKQIESLLGKMGLTPADRSRVSADPGESLKRTPNAWDRLLTQKPQ